MVLNELNNMYYVDADFLVAIYDHDDSLNSKVSLLLQDLAINSKRPYIGENVILEACTIVSQHVNKQQACHIISDIRSGKYMIISPDGKIISDAETWFCSIKSKNVSYSDCLSFAIMKKYKIEWVLSFDIHFKKNGFKRFGIDQ